MSYLDKVVILSKNVAEGLLARLHKAKSDIVSYDFLKEPEWQKLFNKFEKSFNTGGSDNSKVQGWDSFHAQAPKISSLLLPYNNLLIDVVEFCNETLAALRSVPMEIVEVNMEKNEDLVVAYFELLLSFVRVKVMLSLIPDRKLAFAIFMAAAGNAADSFANEVHTLLGEVDDVWRHLMLCFSGAGAASHAAAGSQAVVRKLLLQLRDPLLFAEDQESLRKNGLLNPIHEGVNLSSPSVAKLHTFSTLNAYTELRNADMYREFLIFGFLVFPALFFDPEMFEFFSQIGSGVLCVKLYREQVLNFHTVYDEMLRTYQPGPAELLAPIPKGFKLADSLKVVAKRAVKTCAGRMRCRRAFITAELRSLRLIMSASPGLLGPRLPQVLAAAAVGKAEVMDYFRHRNLATDALRKDCRKHHHANDFLSDDISLLLFELSAISDMAKEFRFVIRDYYNEYLSHDARAIADLIQAVSATAPPILSSYLKALPQDISSYVSSSSQSSSHSSLPTATQKIPLRPPGDSLGLTGNLNLAAFRYNCIRFIAIIYSPRVFLQILEGLGKVNVANGLGVGFDALVSRLCDAAERSFFVDEWGLNTMLKKHCIPHDCWWFKPAVVTEFRAALRYDGPHIVTSCAPCYLSILIEALLGCHPDCPPEYISVEADLKTTIKSMVAVITERAAVVFNSMWTNARVLEEKLQPLQAALRVEAAIKARAEKTGKNAKTPGALGPGQHAKSLPLLPGFESEFSAREAISDITAVRNNTSHLLAGVAKFGSISTGFNDADVYDLPALVQRRLFDAFASTVLSLFVVRSDFPAPASQLRAALLAVTAAGKGVQRVMASGASGAIQSIGSINNIAAAVSAGGAAVSGAAAAGEHLAALLSCLNRPSVAFQNFVTGYRALQTLLSHLPHGSAFFNSSFSTLLIQEFGTSAAAVEKSDRPGRVGLLFRLAEWFVLLASAIASPHSGVHWDANRGAFFSDHTGSFGSGVSGSAGSVELDNFLSPADLRAISGLIGPRGMARIDASLCQFIVSKIETVLAFLASNKSAITDFATNAVQFPLKAQTIVKAPGFADFEDALIVVGVALSLRKILKTALVEALRTLAPNLESVVSAALCDKNRAKPGDALDEAQVMRAKDLRSIAAELGVSEGDTALVDAMQSLAAPIEVRRLFPAAAAASFASEKWAGCRYLSGRAAMQKNEHCSVIAVAELIPVVCIDDTTSSSSSPRALSFGGEYLRLSAHVILTLRAADFGSVTDYLSAGLSALKTLGSSGVMTAAEATASSLLRASHRFMSSSSATRAMTVALELFAEHWDGCHTQHWRYNEEGDDNSVWKCLDTYLPYALRHCSLTDLSLGKRKEKHPLQAFTHAPKVSSGDSNAIDLDGRFGYT